MNNDTPCTFFGRFWGSVRCALCCVDLLQDTLMHTLHTHTHTTHILHTHTYYTHTTHTRPPPPTHTHICTRTHTHTHARACTHTTSKLVSHEDDGDVLADTAQATAVDLTELHSARLQELLEHDAVLALLSCSHPDTQRVQGLDRGYNHT